MQLQNHKIKPSSQPYLCWSLNSTNEPFPTSSQVGNLWSVCACVHVSVCMCVSAMGVLDDFLGLVFSCTFALRKCCHDYKVLLVLTLCRPPASSCRSPSRPSPMIWSLWVRRLADSMDTWACRLLQVALWAWLTGGYCLCLKKSDPLS